jgi:class 3 adenylate cyclase/predicted ATPase
VSTIAEWLGSLGLSEYEQRFAENGIDIEVLPHLTEQHLKDLGVLLGHRLKMLAAIGQLAWTAASSPAPQPAPAHEAKPQDTAERRQLTVMFCDLVGSTTLSTRLDPEDLRSIIGTYHRCCADIIGKAGGFVAKYMGDGVLAYFGYPQAHEEDAERAVRAGLALVGAIPKLDGHRGAALQVRIGIATGLVVVGDLLGEGAAQEQAVVGETPNLAARLQALAEPGAVVISASTRQLTGGLFEYRNLGTVSLKGFGDSVPAWEVTGLGATESRFEALRATTTPLVGRDEEIELLIRRWEQAKAGDGQVVLICGEPGIGKSRIAETILERLSNEPHIRLRYFCSPHHQDSAFYPSIAQLERAAGFRREDTDTQRLEKLEAVLAEGTNDLSEAVPLLADLLSIPTGDHYQPLNLTPQKRKERTLQVQLAQIEGLAARQPVVMAFEDIHWSDPTTREALDLIIDRVPELRVLTILTFRPEFAPPWVGRPHVAMLTLSRLPPRRRAEMIAHLTGGKALPREIADQIINRTDGVPLFIEELTKTVVESGIVADEGDHYALKGPVAPLAIPSSLHASLLARLDRLAPTREIAQIGAALGRSFSHELISAVARLSPQKLDEGLAQLVSAELIFRRGTPPDAEYTFKHAMVQDAAYSTLLRERRRVLHARIAEILESQFAEVAENQPELLARHCSEAGLIEKAVHFWGKAGQRSLERSSLVEAIEQLSHALAKITTLPPSRALRHEEIKLQVALITPLLVVKGFAAAETKTATERARLLIEHAESLGEPLEDPLLLFSVLFGNWVANFVAFNGEVLRELAVQFLALAEKQAATAPLMVGNQLMGVSLASTGEFIQAQKHYDRSLALYDPAVHRTLLTQFAGQDMHVVTLSFRSLTLWMLGYPESALADANLALEDARKIDHASTLMFALFWSGLTTASCGKFTVANTLGEELVILADRNGSPTWKFCGMDLQGRVSALIGESAHAIQMITAGLNGNRSMGASFLEPFLLLSLASANGELGNLKEAWRCIDEAMTLIGKTKDNWCEAEANRVAGEIALKSPESGAAKAETYFERALSVARHQQAKSWEVCAANSLARLWRDQGKRTEAHDLLAPVYGWFTEGFDTPVLKEAKSLLEQLTA